MNHAENGRGTGARRIAGWVGWGTIVCLAIVMAFVSRPAVDPEGPNVRTPGALAPQGMGDPRAAHAGSWNPRGVLPLEDLTEAGAVARGVVVPSIIDTRTFPEQIQRVDPGPGEPLRGGMFLPKHESIELGRRAGERSSLTAGGLRGVSAIEIGRGFTGITNTGWTPPDPSLAVGPDHVVVTVNQSVAFQTKDGVTQFAAPLNSSGSPGFFEPVGAQGFTFDPKCFYDHHADRFVILALEVYGTGTVTETDDEATITFAVSDDDDPNGVWFKYRTNAVITVGSDTFWWDYPGFGFDADAIYVTGNLFGLNNNGFAGAGFRVFDKAPLLTGSPATFSTLRDGNLSSVQCAQHFGSNAQAFFTCVRFFDTMTVIALQNPLTLPSVVFVDLAVPSFDSTGEAPTPGGDVDTVGLRVMNTHWRDGALTTCHTVFSNTLGVHLARWYEFDLGSWPTSGSPSLVQSGDIALGGSDETYFPAIYSDASGNLGLVCASSSASENVRMLVTTRQPGDPAGTMGAPVEVSQGANGSSGRWGDYYDIAIDPLDDRTFWAIGETQEAFGWATFVQEFRVPAPPCYGDLDFDGDVDVLDFGFFAANFGDFGFPPFTNGDHDGDGDVDVLDFGLFAASLGLCP